MKKLIIFTTKEDLTIQSESGKTATIPWTGLDLDTINQLRDYSVPVGGNVAYFTTSLEVGDYTPLHNLVLTA